MDISKEDLNENVKTAKAMPSRRQLKRVKVEKVEVKRRQTRSSSIMEKALNYVSMVGC